MENCAAKAVDSGRVLVVLHVYYEEYLPYYIGKLRNIHGCEWDLTVTGHDLSESSRREIIEFKSDAKFYDTPNVGYDVWPFIYAIKRTELDNYCFVIKLHTKNQDNMTNRLNGLPYTGAMWRSELVDALLDTRERFYNLCDKFKNNADVGIAYAGTLDIICGDKLQEDSHVLFDEMARLGLPVNSKHFCGGTMFAVRASALRWMKDDRISEDIFQHSDGSHKTATMAHVYERILSMAVSALGYSTWLIWTDWHKYVYMMTKRRVQPLLEWLFSIDYHGSSHEKFLTLFGFMIKLN